MVCHIASSQHLYSDAHCLPSIDPFLPFESDPLRTQALDSSLWELLSHTEHYHAPVSTMCKVFSEAFTKPGYSMEDFLDHTYNTVWLSPSGDIDADDAHLLQLFETEINRKVKREPALAVESRTKMFPDLQDEEELMEKRSEIDSTDIVGELWTFG